MNAKSKVFLLSLLASAFMVSQAHAERNDSPSATLGYAGGNFLGNAVKGALDPFMGNTLDAADNAGARLMNGQTTVNDSNIRSTVSVDSLDVKGRGSSASLGDVSIGNAKITNSTIETSVEMKGDLNVSDQANVSIGNVDIKNGAIIENSDIISTTNLKRVDVRGGGGLKAGGISIGN